MFILLMWIEEQIVDPCFEGPDLVILKLSTCVVMSSALSCYLIN